MYRAFAVEHIIRKETGFCSHSFFFNTCCIPALCSMFFCSVTNQCYIRALLIIFPQMWSIVYIYTFGMLMIPSSVKACGAKNKS